MGVCGINSGLYMVNYLKMREACKAHKSWILPMGCPFYKHFFFDLTWLVLLCIQSLPMS